jgi:hypothetical protein
MDESRCILGDVLDGLALVAGSIVACVGLGAILGHFDAEREAERLKPYTAHLGHCVTCKQSGVTPQQLSEGRRVLPCLVKDDPIRTANARLR